MIFTQKTDYAKVEEKLSGKRVKQPVIIPKNALFQGFFAWLLATITKKFK